MRVKVITVLGTRPQFIKAAPVSSALRRAGHTEIIVHTGQHYDHAMSRIFFDELGLPAPDVNLEVGSGPHGWQTGQILVRAEEVMSAHRPDWVLVYGDTNSTLGGALAACKLRVPLAHVESGLRSHNREMPEEHNRVLVDHCSDLLFCPTSTAVENLLREGIEKRVHLVGDTMLDAVRQFSGIARHRSTILRDLDLDPGAFLLATLHRPYNTDHPETFGRILEAFLDANETLVFPVHPRARKIIAGMGPICDSLQKAPHIRMIEPVGYLDMLALEENARIIITDSGGVQKEAYFFHVPCITVRPETEWAETVESGWNRVVGSDKDQILSSLRNGWTPQGLPPSVFGDGRAAMRIVEHLSRNGGGEFGH